MTIKRVHFAENKDGDCMSEAISYETGEFGIEQWADDSAPSIKIYYSVDDCKQLIKFLTDHIEEHGR